MTYRTMLENNRRWAADRATADPQYFPNLASEHKPHALFIGCSDARVPADVITQSGPGELFVHRNIANQANASDPNFQSGLQYAVEGLKVTDIIVCGHEECGGIRAALTGTVPPLVENWVAGIRTTVRLHDEELYAIANIDNRAKRLVELNVIEQVHNVARTPVVQNAWASGATLRVHGWVYGLKNGLLRDLGVTMAGPALEREARAGTASESPTTPRPRSESPVTVQLAG